MTQPKTVLFFTTQLGGGGAESHALRVMNHLDRSRYRPMLAVTRKGGNYEPFLRDDVPVHEISRASLKSSTGRVLLSSVLLRKLCVETQPAILASIMDIQGVVALATVATLTEGRPKVVPIIQAPPTIVHQESRVGKLILPAMRSIFHRADRIISLSHGVREDLIQLDPRLANQISVIHNACVDERIEGEVSYEDVPPSDVPVILAAGRLAYQKGYPTLIDAFAQVSRSTDAVLWILGEGPDRAAIEAQIEKNGLSARVRLFGFQKNPHAFMRRATVFCLSSVYEGFGNVIVEAMASGAPVVSTDCPYGPSEIIRNEESGLLVPVGDANALARALIRVVRDEPFRRSLAERGKERSKAFHAKAIAREYADEFDTILGQPKLS